MNHYTRLLLYLVIVFISLTIILDISLPICSVEAKANSHSTVDLEPDQSFSSDAGSAIEYNIYIENKGKTIASYAIDAVSDNYFYVEVWRDTDQIGDGDIQLVPPQESAITLSPGEVATLVVTVSIPSDAIDGSLDNTVIKAVDIDSGDSDSVIVTTTVGFDLPYPSDWIQLGSDPTFPTPPSPEKIDVKALYYVNNNTDVFFRIAEVSKPDTRSFLYSVYLDTKAGGQQIDSYNYDYLLSSDGILYEWDGISWINSGFPTFWQIDGTAIVIWAKLDNIEMDIQEIQILAYTTTKDWSFKDTLGSFTILKSNIAEIPLILIPILSVCVYFMILRRTKKTAHIPQ
jgi:archaellum component FlaG (FlaF/FlaG flagellin family)